MMAEAAERGAAPHRPAAGLLAPPEAGAPQPVDLNDTVARHARPAAEHHGRQRAHIETRAAARPVAGDDRPDPDRAGHPQPGHQRPRRHGGRRRADRGHRQRRRSARPSGRRSPPAGEYVMVAGHRHRLGHERRGAGQGVRALLHHQGGRQGIGPWPQPGFRPGQAVRRRRDGSTPRSAQGTSVKVYLPRADAGAGAEPMRRRRGAPTRRAAATVAAGGRRRRRGARGHRRHAARPRLSRSSRPAAAARRWSCSTTTRHRR